MSSRILTMAESIISESRLLAVGLLFGVLLIFIFGLSRAGKWKPQEPYTFAEEEGVLRVRGSRQVVIYYLAVATAALFISLLSIVLAIVVFWPLSKYQWAGITILGTVGLGGYVGFLYLILPRKWDAFDYVFERGRNRFLRGNTEVSAVSNVRNLQVQRKENRETSKASYVLSVILKGGEPHLLYELEEPATPLLQLSERIAAYLGTEIHQGEVLTPNGHGTTWLALFAEILVAILGIVAVVLLAMRE
jgi:hypothetical protein